MPWGVTLKSAIIIVTAALFLSQRAQCADQLQVASAIPSIRITAATELPANPDGGGIDEYCSDLSPPFKITAKSAGGQLVTKRGWIVTSETKLGNYDAVTFVGALDAATSATCVHRDGNLAIFDGSRLIAIAYARPRADDGLGSAEQIDGRRIRLHWGLPGAPIADVVLDDGVRIEHTAREDRVCGGAALVPNIFQQDIHKARKTLLAYGWRPRRSAEQLNGEMDEVLRKQGVVEVEYCSGTGYGYCGFNYVSRKGFRLAVTSAGDDPNVIDYRVDCTRHR